MASSSSSSARRLVIEKMVLENFKSYAGVQEIGPFHRCFTAVVGPNGSGKSNVIDALLFVFGKRAKQIRQKKIGELVHHSATHPDIQTASVTVHFCEVLEQGPADGADLQAAATSVVPIPGSELVLRRTATRSHQSKYYVNERSASFTEVTDLLKAKGVDLENNRFLILQGEVEQVAMMPPKATGAHDEGMLEYLEDIIGTNKYIQMIEERTGELDKAQEVRSERLERVKLVAREKQGLESAKKEAEEFLGTEQEIVRKRALIAQVLRRHCEKAAEAAAARKKAAEERLQAEKERNAESSQRLKEMEKAAKAAANELEPLVSASSKAKSELASFQEKDVQLREDKKHLAARGKKLSKTVSNEEEKEKASTEGAKRKLEEKEELEREAAKLREHLEGEDKVLDELYEGLKGETGPLQERMEQLQRKLVPSQKKLNELEAKVAVAKSELSLLDRETKERAEELEKAKASVSEAVEAERRSGEDLERVKVALGEQKHKSAEAKTRIGKLVEAEKVLGEQGRKLRSRVEELRAEKNATASRGAVHAAIAELKSSKAVKGICGRLGDLGSINPKYDVAVTTACGALDNIVVQTTTAAQQCVERLRSGNVGRATFVILDEVSRSESVAAGLSAEFEAPPNSQRLFDLVRPTDAKYRAAFYWALGDTLVVPDIDVATATAFDGPRRRRVVTLRGELIETQGTMSGGGRAVLRGGMRTRTKDDAPRRSRGGPSSSRDTEGDREEEEEEELPELEQKLNRTIEELAQLRTQKAQAEAEAAALESLSETTVSKLQMDIKDKKARREECQSRAKKLEEQPGLTEEQEKRGEEMQATVRETEEVIASTTKASEALESEIAGIKDEIMKAGGTRLREQKERVAAVTESLQKAESGATRCGVEAAAQNKAAEKAKNALAKARAEQESNAERLEQILAGQTELEEQASGVMQASEEAEKLVQEKTAQIQERQGELDELRGDAAKAAATEAGIREEVEEASKVLAEKQGSTRSHAKQLADLASSWQSLEDLLNEGKEEVPKPSQPASSGGDDEKPDGEGDVEMSDAQAQPSSPAKQSSPFKVLSESELSRHSVEQLRVEIGALEEAKNKMAPNMGAIREYHRKEREHAARMSELDEATAQRDRLRQECDDLKKKRLDEFMEGFEQITLKLKEMYRMITIGGDAELELVDRLNPFSEGVVFSVRPAKKSWKNISNLSGGEKTLSSLALVFALHHYKPTPIYVMDEIDAALDFRNVSIVANYIRERTRGAQFVVVSLRNYMFELADRLVGIFKVADCTSSIAITPSQYTLLTQTPSSTTTTTTT